jgi:hypothetical protein
VADGLPAADTVGEGVAEDLEDARGAPAAGVGVTPRAGIGFEDGSPSRRSTGHVQDGVGVPGSLP